MRWVGAARGPKRAATFAYDAKGNMTSGNGLGITYTAFNKPATITRGTASVSFDHDPEYQRYAQTNLSGVTLYIVGGGVLAERFAGSGGTVRWTNYLMVGGRYIGIQVENSDETRRLRRWSIDRPRRRWMRGWRSRTSRRSRVAWFGPMFFWRRRRPGRRRWSSGSRQFVDHVGNGGGPRGTAQLSHGPIDKPGKLQMNWPCFRMAAPAGGRIGVRGNTGDPKTLRPQVEKVRASLRHRPADHGRRPRHDLQRADRCHAWA